MAASQEAEEALAEEEVHGLVLSEELALHLVEHAGRDNPKVMSYGHHHHTTTSMATLTPPFQPKPCG